MIGKLTPLWLMTAGTKHLTNKKEDWINVFGDGVHSEFLGQVKTAPQVSFEPCGRMDSPNIPNPSSR